MSEHPKPTCKVIRRRETYEGKQALSYIRDRSRDHRLAEDLHAPAEHAS